MRAAESHYSTRAGKLDRRARQKIGHELRAMFNDFTQWGLPERLRDLLDQLEIAEEKGAVSGHPERS